MSYILKNKQNNTYFIGIKYKAKQIPNSEKLKRYVFAEFSPWLRDAYVFQGRDEIDDLMKMHPNDLQLCEIYRIK